MKASEAAKCIKLAEEFEFDKAALLTIESADVETEEEYKEIAEALFKNYWGLPRLQKQKTWTQFVLDMVEKRKDSHVFLLHFLQCIKEKWMQIDIRLKNKFILLVQEIMKKLTQNSEMAVEQLITKGPEAAYDLELMNAYLESRQVLSSKDTTYLFKYLLKNANTYFTNFFIKKVLHRFEKEGVSQIIAEKAYAEGNRKETSLVMRELLYSIYNCRAR